MPLYSDHNYYYGSDQPPPYYLSSSYNPPTSRISSPYSFSYMSPITAMLSAGIGANPVPRGLRSYSPMLSAIPESNSPLMSRRDISGHRSSPRHLPAKTYYRQPRPVVINTENIDVSKRKTDDSNSESTPGLISRGRTIVRMQTKKRKENPELRKKKSQAELLMEKYLIKEKPIKEEEPPKRKRIWEEREEERNNELAHNGTIKRSNTIVKKAITPLPSPEVVISEQVNEVVPQRKMSIDSELLKEEAALFDSMIQEELGLSNLKEMVIEDETINKSGDSSPNHKTKKVSAPNVRRKSSHNLLEEINLPKEKNKSYVHKRRSSKNLALDETVLSEIIDDDSAKEDICTKINKRKSTKKKKKMGGQLKFKIDSLHVEEKSSPKLLRKFQYEVIVEEGNLGGRNSTRKPQEHSETHLNELVQENIPKVPKENLVTNKSIVELPGKITCTENSPNLAEIESSICDSKCDIINDSVKLDDYSFNNKAHNLSKSTTDKDAHLDRDITNNIAGQKVSNIQKTEGRKDKFAIESLVERQVKSDLKEKKCSLLDEIKKQKTYDKTSEDSVHKSSKLGIIEGKSNKKEVHSTIHTFKEHSQMESERKGNKTDHSISPETLVSPLSSKLRKNEKEFDGQIENSVIIRNESSSNSNTVINELRHNDTKPFSTEIKAVSNVMTQKQMLLEKKHQSLAKSLQVTDKNSLSKESDPKVPFAVEHKTKSSVVQKDVVVDQLNKNMNKCKIEVNKDVICGDEDENVNVSILTASERQTPTEEDKSLSNQDSAMSLTHKFTHSEDSKTDTSEEVNKKGTVVLDHVDTLSQSETKTKTKQLPVPLLSKLNIINVSDNEKQKNILPSNKEFQSLDVLTDKDIKQKTIATISKSGDSSSLIEKSDKNSKTIIEKLEKKLDKSINHTNISIGNKDADKSDKFVKDKSLSSIVDDSKKENKKEKKLYDKNEEKSNEIKIKPMETKREGEQKGISDKELPLMKNVNISTTNSTHVKNVTTSSTGYRDNVSNDEVKGHKIEKCQKNIKEETINNKPLQIKKIEDRKHVLESRPENNKKIPGIFGDNHDVKTISKMESPLLFKNVTTPKNEGVRKKNEEVTLNKKHVVFDEEDKKSIPANDKSDKIVDMSYKVESTSTKLEDCISNTSFDEINVCNDVLLNNEISVNKLECSTTEVLNKKTGREETTGKQDRKIILKSKVSSQISENADTKITKVKPVPLKLEGSRIALSKAIEENKEKSDVKKLEDKKMYTKKESSCQIMSKIDNTKIGLNKTELITEDTRNGVLGTSKVQDLDNTNKEFTSSKHIVLSNEGEGKNPSAKLENTKKRVETMLNDNSITIKPEDNIDNVKKDLKSKPAKTDQRDIVIIKDEATIAKKHNEIVLSCEAGPLVVSKTNEEVITNDKVVTKEKENTDKASDSNGSNKTHFVKAVKESKKKRIKSESDAADENLDKPDSSVIVLEGQNIQVSEKSKSLNEDKSKKSDKKKKKSKEKSSVKNTKSSKSPKKSKDTTKHIHKNELPQDQQKHTSVCITEESIVTKKSSAVIKSEKEKVDSESITTNVTTTEKLNELSKRSTRLMHFINKCLRLSADNDNIFVEMSDEDESYSSSDSSEYATDSEEDTLTDSSDSEHGSSETRDHGSPTRRHSNAALSLDDEKTEPRHHPGRVTPPATTIPKFRKYTMDDFQFLKVLGKGSFGKVLLAELRGTQYYYAVKCLKKDVVLEDDDVECTLIERKVLALGTNHPYLCHLFCTFQTDSHLFFVMEYLNGGDLMFHIQQQGRFDEGRARFYAAEIVSGLKFLHKKGIVYRDLKLDNILLDFDGHVRIADFGMCKLQIYLDRTADTFCGTPDYMAPEIIKGLKYNQCVDWWSFGILMYEMLVGQSPFSGCDEDDLFWCICNRQPHYPRFITLEGKRILMQLLEKDANKRLGSCENGAAEVMAHPFFNGLDWDRLERRELQPPFKPNVKHPLDVHYFDKHFTAERACLTPIDPSILQSMDQTQFQGFSYTNPNVTD